jgi:hypothetical protein
MSRLLKLAVMLLPFLAIAPSNAQIKNHNISFELYNHVFNLQIDAAINLGMPNAISDEYIASAYDTVNSGNYAAIVDTLKSFKEKQHLNDWLYYQLIRKTVQEFSPKKANYERYTFYKWFLLIKSGYDARLTIADQRIILYVYNKEDISEVPYLTFNKKKYICLNIHDYLNADLNKVPPKQMLSRPEGTNAFSYKINMMPEFEPDLYKEKRLEFAYRHKTYHFNIKYNPQIEALFQNYPGVTFEDYFNIPLSKETYSSLIPLLRKNVQGMKQKKGVDYLMRFTRYAFLYENDQENYGKEKRLSPEETLYATYSDCDDRVALFFYLVKEIYNLPMIALLYPTHITMAVQFDTPVGAPIVYNGKIYSMCEPTPQADHSKIGQVSSKLKNVKYEVVYCYEPAKKP